MVQRNAIVSLSVFYLELRLYGTECFKASVPKAHKKHSMLPYCLDCEGTLNMSLTIRNTGLFLL